MTGSKRSADVIHERTRVRQAFSRDRIGNRYAAIVALIPCGAIAIQHADALGADARGLRQSLDDELMVAGLARSGSIALGEHRRQRSLHDRAI